MLFSARIRTNDKRLCSVTIARCYIHTSGVEGAQQNRSPFSGGPVVCDCGKRGNKDRSVPSDSINNVVVGFSREEKGGRHSIIRYGGVQGAFHGN